MEGRDVSKDRPAGRGRGRRGGGGRGVEGRDVTKDRSAGRGRGRMSNFNILKTLTLLVHAGLFGRLHNPPISDTDFRIFNV